MKRVKMPRSIPENSLYIERTLQHAFLAKLCQLVWANEASPLLEVSTAEIDNRGYDVVLSLGTVTRHVQLKSNRLGGKRRNADVHVGLAEKESGCVVWYEYDPASLEISNYRFFGGLPGKRLPNLAKFKVAKKSRGNAAGLKTDRRNVRLVPRNRFRAVSSLKDLLVRLFGELG
jgi:hypothetical protein